MLHLLGRYHVADLQAVNAHLKRNIEKQVEIYEKANGTRTAVKMIVGYTAEELCNEESIVIIDACADNKLSGSEA